MYIEKIHEIAKELRSRVEDGPCAEALDDIIYESGRGSLNFLPSTFQTVVNCDHKSHSVDRMFDKLIMLILIVTQRSESKKRKG